MLLRRVIEHVKAQNWTAVALDFVIVIIGVFIGIQVSNWNDERVESYQSLATLSRLQEESEQSLSYLQGRIAFETELDADRDAVARWLSNNAIENERGENDMTRGIVTMAWYAGISPTRSIYDEVTASGAFGGIADEEIRVAVADFYAELDYVQSQLAFFRQHAGKYYEPAGLAIKSIYDPAAPERQRVSIDFNKLAKNEIFKSTLVKALRDQLRFRYFMHGLLEKAEQMCAKLSAATDQSCEPLHLENISQSDNRNQVDRESE